MSNGAPFRSRSAARSALLAAHLVGTACTAPSPSVDGEWIGDLGRGPSERLEILIDSSGRRARVSLRGWQLEGVVGYRVAAGQDSLAFTGSTERDTISFRGVLRDGAWLGEAARGEDRRPFDLRRFDVLSDSRWASLIGTYRAEDGHLIGIARFSEFGLRPFVIDYGTGRIGPLYPSGRDRFLVGRSLVSPVFPADTLEVGFEPDSTVRRVRLVEGGRPPVTAERLTTRDEEVRFANRDVTLTGTLTLPPGPGPHPALVLAHGSGPQTRDGFGPWVRFFVGLDFAVLAFDKRGTGRSTGEWKEVDFRPLAADVLAGVRTIAARKDIRADRIGLWGISQGGWIGPLVISQAPEEIAFLVVHAGTGTTVREQGRLNLLYELRFSGLPDSAIETALRYHALNDSVTETGKGWDRLRAFYESHRAEADWLWPPQPVDDWFRKYYRELMDFDPRAHWEKVRCPVLLLFGELDANVPPGESWPPIERALRRAGNRSVTSRVFPKANHVLLEAETGARTEYASLSRFVPGYFEIMAEWLATHGR